MTNDLNGFLRIVDFNRIPSFYWDHFVSYVSYKHNIVLCSSRMSIKKRDRQSHKRLCCSKWTIVCLTCRRVGSPACYYLLRTESLHASQLLYPFYIPFLKQSALGQSRLPGICLLHQGS